MSPWGEEATLGTGLADRYQLTIPVGGATIGNPFPNAADKVCVVFNGERNVNGQIDDGHIWLTVGKFESGDKDGTFLVHEEQSPSVFDERNEPIKKINKNSGYGRFLASALEVGGDVLESNQDPARAKYEIWDVKFWEGLTLDIEEIEETFTYKQGPKQGQEGTSRQPLVRAMSRAGEGAAGATTSTAAAPSAAASNGTVSPADHDSFISYLEAFVAAGGSSSDEKAQKAYYEAARS